jgi:hypothetical protein
MILKSKELGGYLKRGDEGRFLFPSLSVRFPFSSNNNERVKSPTYPASIWSRFGIKLWRGEGFPTNPPFLFLLPQRGFRSLFVDGSF